VAIATAGGDYTSNNRLQQPQHPSIRSLRRDASWICSGETPGALDVKRTAVHECKRRGDGKLHNAMRCESIRWRSTLADNREVLEHRYAAKQHLVHSIWGAHKQDLERGMLKQRPAVEITCSNCYQFRAPVNKVKSCFIRSATDSIADLDDLQRFESAVEH